MIHSNTRKPSDTLMLISEHEERFLDTYARAVAKNPWLLFDLIERAKRLEGEANG